MSAKSTVAMELRRFVAYLEGKQLSLSDARHKVFKTVMATHGHFAAEKVVKICQTRNIDVSRASVYRTLKELLEAGIIRETAFGKKHQLYEHVYDEDLHHHARCVRCQGLVEFPDLNEDKIYRPILEKQGFHILGHEMHFYGICRKCQEA